jgi:chromosome segregation ATPase
MQTLVNDWCVAPFNSLKQRASAVAEDHLSQAVLIATISGVVLAIICSVSLVFIAAYAFLGATALFALARLKDSKSIEEISSSSASIKEAAGKICQVNEAFAGQIGALKEENRQLNETVVQISKDRGVMKIHIDLLKGVLDKAEEENAKLKQCAESVRESKEQLHEEVESLKKERDSLNMCVNSLGDKIDGLREVNRLLSESSLKNSETCSSMKQANQDLSSNVGNLRDVVACLEAGVGNMTTSRVPGEAGEVDFESVLGQAGALKDESAALSEEREKTRRMREDSMTSMMAMMDLLSLKVKTLSKKGIL